MVSDQGFEPLEFQILLVRLGLSGDLGAAATQCSLALINHIADIRMARDVGGLRAARGI